MAGGPLTQAFQPSLSLSHFLPPSQLNFSHTFSYLFFFPLAPYLFHSTPALTDFYLVSLSLFLCLSLPFSLSLALAARHVSALLAEIIYRTQRSRG